MFQTKFYKKAVSTVLTLATVLTIGSLLPKKSVNAAGSNYASKVVSVAYAEVGKSYYKKNTAYASYFDNLRSSGKKWYNGCKNGYDWCDVFVDWCFVQAYGYSAAQSMTYQCENSCGAGCVYSAKYYGYTGSRANNSHFISGANTPQVGDQIFFYRSGNFNDSYAHTGLVVAVYGGYVYTVEGNTSSSLGTGYSAVNEKHYKIGDSSIVGYGRPNFTASPSPDSFVNGLYTGALGRNADGGKSGWISEMKSGKQHAGQIAWGFYNSQEFRYKYLSDEEYINRLYRGILGREPDAAGKASWLGCLKAGHTRYQVFLGFVNSAEFLTRCNNNGWIWRRMS